MKTTFTDGVINFVRALVSIFREKSKYEEMYETFYFLPWDLISFIGLILSPLVSASFTDASKQFKDFNCVVFLLCNNCLSGFPNTKIFSQPPVKMNTKHYRPQELPFNF